MSRVGQHEPPPTSTCVLCHKEYKNRKQLRKHVNRGHKMSMDVYNNEHDTMRARRERAFEEEKKEAELRILQAKAAREEAKAAREEADAVRAHARMQAELRGSRLSSSASPSLRGGRCVGGGAAAAVWW